MTSSDMQDTPAGRRAARADGPRPSQPKRRTFTAAYKLAMIEKYDTATEPGAKGALLRGHRRRGSSEHPRLTHGTSLVAPRASARSDATLISNHAWQEQKRSPATPSRKPSCDVHVEKQRGRLGRDPVEDQLFEWAAAKRPLAAAVPQRAAVSAADRCCRAAHTPVARSARACAARRLRPYDSRPRCRCPAAGPACPRRPARPPGSRRTWCSAGRPAGRAGSRERGAVRVSELCGELRGYPFVRVHEVHPVMADHRQPRRTLALRGEAKPRLLDHLGTERARNRCPAVRRADSMTTTWSA